MSAKPIFREICFQLRWGLPVWLLGMLTSWWPNNRITIRLRGTIYRPFFKKCGQNFQMASGIHLLNTQGIEIGDNVYISYQAWLNGLGGLTIGHEVVIGPFVSISTLTHCYKAGSFRFGGARFAPVVIGNGSWLASHVSISSGVTIGQGCLVAANAAVTKDTPAGSIVGGVPAVVIGQCHEQEATITSRSGFSKGA